LPEWKQYQDYQKSFEAPKRPLTLDEKAALARAQGDIAQTIKEKFAVEAPREWMNPFFREKLDELLFDPSRFPK
jgi:hypothetical protein